MPTPIDTEGVRRLLERGAQVVEVLPASEFDEQHLPGAIHLPLTELDAESARRLDPGRPVVADCFDYQ